MIIVETKGLKRTYQIRPKAAGITSSLKNLFSPTYLEKIALQETNLTVNEGEVIGLVGANGAGKTTLIKILSGLIYPSQGSAIVLGHEPYKRNHDYLRQMGVLLGQKAQLWWDLTPADSFNLLGRIYDIDRTTANNRMREMTALFGLDDKLTVPLRQLSLGERMKMEFIGSLLHRPKIIFLDEPTIGLDIMAQASVREFLNSYVKQFKPTIFLTSHYMDDIAAMASRLLLMSHGQIVYDGTVPEFRKQATEKQQLTVKFAEPASKDIFYHGKKILALGQQVYKESWSPSEIPAILQELIGHLTIASITIDEVDFEDIIHQFMKNAQITAQAVKPVHG
jgi:ABC-2 type transport system ATP-binding protein